MKRKHNISNKHPAKSTLNSYLDSSESSDDPYEEITDGQDDHLKNVTSTSSFSESSASTKRRYKQTPSITSSVVVPGSLEGGGPDISQFQDVGVEQDSFSAIPFPSGGDSSEPGSTSKPPRSKKYRKTVDLEKDFVSRTTGIHTPSLTRHKDGKDHRKRCRVCKTRKTDLICYECEIPLCISGYGKQNCWHIFHNCEFLVKPADEGPSDELD
jgi:hypothetical protein